MTKVFSARAGSVDGFITGRDAGPGPGLRDLTLNHGTAGRPEHRCHLPRR
jgi:hypothetical protein